MRTRFGVRWGTLTMPTFELGTSSRYLVPIALLAPLLILTACGSHATNNRAATTAAAPAPSSVTTLRATSATGAPGTTSPGVAGAVSVQVRPGAGGTVLTSPAGKTLYVFDRDAAGASNCTGGCTSTWPPLTLATGAAVAPPGLAGSLGTITRDDGARQVTYNGRPLYTYSGDAQPGAMKGDGIGGVWHVAGTAAPTSAPAAKPRSYPGY